jgi:glutathione S-transferase
MAELVFYSNPQSRGRIVHWMLEELGVPYTTQWVQYGAEMKSASYLAINPMGKVPALRHGDVVVTEAAAICAYLADAYADKGLAPASGHPDRAAYYRWMFFAAGPLESAIVAKAMGWEVPPGRNAAVGFGSFADTINALETALQPGPYICGDRFTAADVYVGSSLNWGLRFGTIDKTPLFEAYVNRIHARVAAQRANALSEAQLQLQAAKP